MIKSCVVGEFPAFYAALDNVVEGIVLRWAVHSVSFDGKIRKPF